MQTDVMLEDSTDQKPDRVTKTISAMDKKTQLEQWYTEYHLYVYHIALKMVRSSERAEDIVQDVFVQIYRSLDQFKGQSKPSTWIYKITVNQCLMELRKEKQKRNHLSELVKRQHVYQSAVASIQSYSHPMDDKILTEAILADLPEKYRLILIMREMEGITPKEIQETLGISAPTYKIRLERARQKLVSLYKNYMKSEASLERQEKAKDL